MLAPKYINWLVSEKSVTFRDGVPLICYKLDYKTDETIFAEWALHIRRHYESDTDLMKESLSATGMSTEDYLREYVIPQMSDPFGPASRSNDFTEIMISDLLEFVHGYTVPRCKQDNRSRKCNSAHGTDILAYRHYSPKKEPDSRDELIAAEVKAGLSSDSYEPIKKAVLDSKKYDALRYAHTLNFYRKPLIYQQKPQQAEEIARFQQKSECDFVLPYIAAAIISRENIPNNIISNIDGQELKLQKGRQVLLTHGKKLMSLAHQIYERCIQ